MKAIIHLDTESTGLDINEDRIIQLSLIKTDLEFNIIEKKKLLLSNCGVPIHEHAVKAHGITEEKILNYYQETFTTLLKEYKTISDVPGFSYFAPKIFNFLNEADCLAGYNIKQFDIPLLYEEFYRAGTQLNLPELCNWQPKPIIDSCVIFKQRESRTLSAAVKFYCGKELEVAHDAENDAIASIEVLKGQVEEYGLYDPNNLGNPEPTFELQLIKESCYENEEEKLDLAGKIILRADGIPCWGNFGKCKNQPVKNDLGYCDWILNSDFSNNTKNVLRKILGS